MRSGAEIVERHRVLPRNSAPFVNLELIFDMSQLLVRFLIPYRVSKENRGAGVLACAGQTRMSAPHKYPTRI